MLQSTNNHKAIPMIGIKDTDYELVVSALIDKARVHITKDLLATALSTLAVAAEVAEQGASYSRDMFWVDAVQAQTDHTRKAQRKLHMIAKEAVAAFDSEVA